VISSDTPGLYTATNIRESAGQMYIVSDSNALIHMSMSVMLTSVYNTGKMGLVSCAGSMCLGHESSGVIARLGSNLAALAREAEQAEKDLQGSEKQAEAVVGKGVLKIGTRVTLEPGVTCRMCHDCRGGQYQVSSVSFKVDSIAVKAESGDGVF
jgi:hypothetical protein